MSTLYGREGGGGRKPLGVPLDRVFKLPRRGVLRRWTPVMDGERCAPGLYGTREICASGLYGEGIERG